MFQPLSLFIGLRYTRPKTGNGFISFVNFFSITGILLGVAALVIVVSIMNGFESELKRRILGVVPQVVIKPQEQGLDDWQSLRVMASKPEQVLTAVPVVNGEAVFQSTSELRGGLVYGVWPEHESGHSEALKHIVSGSVDSLVPGKFRILLGRGLASKLGVSIGEKVRVMVARGSVYSPMGRLPSQRTFVVAGLYEIGADIDSHVALIHGEDAARLMRLRRGQVDGVRLYLQDAFMAEQVAAQLSSQLPGNLTIETWAVSQGTLFDAVKAEKRMMWMLLSLIIAVAAFNIVSALVMLVSEKNRDIAILKTQGLSRGTIHAVFLSQGLFNGLFGALIGALLGSLFVLNIDLMTQILGLPVVPGAGIGKQALPVDYQLGQVIMVVLGSISISVLAALYPAYRASRIMPAEALRYE